MNENVANENDNQPDKTSFETKKLQKKREAELRQKIYSSTKELKAKIKQIEMKIEELEKSQKELEGILFSAETYQDIKFANEKGIQVANTPGDKTTRSVAEHALSMILALGTKLVDADEYCRLGSYECWDPMIYLGTRTIGKTLGIIGLGRIGSTVATLALGLRMKVIANNRSPKTMEGVEMVSKEELLKRADVEEIKKIEGVKTAGAMTLVPGNVKKDETLAIATVLGIDPVMEQVMTGLRMEKGRFINI